MIIARDLTIALGGRWYGCYGTAPCPICQPEGRAGLDALTISDGHKGLLLYCHKSACGFRDITVALGIQTRTFTALDPEAVAQRAADRQAEAEKRARLAMTLWREAEPIHGTVAEAYLRWRGITCVLPETLRFHPECWHPKACRFPAMLARVDGAERFAVHRTYLRPDGCGKAEVEPSRAMLGAVQGGAVRLKIVDGPLVVAEGIETALSLANAFQGVPATIWAALSTSGVRGLNLPALYDHLTIATDGDAPGMAAGQALAERASALGWDVSFLPAPAGRDWNDILARKGVAL